MKAVEDYSMELRRVMSARWLIGLLACAVCIGLVFLMSGVVSAANQSIERLVNIHDYRVNRTIATRATTVRQALELAGVVVDEKQDLVEPNIDMELSGANFEVNIFRARPVTIIDGRKRVHITTAAQTPVQITKAAGVKLYTEDKVEFMRSDNLLLDGASLVLNIERAAQRTVTEKVDIAFPVEQVKDNSHPMGYKQITQLGEAGVRKVTYQVQAKHGMEVGRREVGSEIIKQPKKQIEIIGTKPTNPLTKSKGAQMFKDSKGVAHRETYYDLPMNIVISACGSGGYTVRADGAKVDKDGYILVAANYANYPRCSVVETSMGLGKVYDTGGFAKVHPHGFDLATDWTNGDGR